MRGSAQNFLATKRRAHRVLTMNLEQYFNILLGFFCSIFFEATFSLFLSLFFSQKFVLCLFNAKNSSAFVLCVAGET